ncbi:hypothetical protein J2T15_001858 [Paenibacillus harenae]|uniref:Uncharacterized protein n=1 Tax=Paenibacillus harenae TaxID=306543 RepID=A0ABT9TYI0_PAEHA|nr:hypothetical protein [Paenibacillus harenae]MDQ0112423.1 hypothetical protein [Paenibacillus harenae]
MKILSSLFIKKFDYVAFPICIVSLMLITINLFYKTGFSSSMLWSQVLIVILYYLATRGRAERNLESKGIEPNIFLSVFVLLVVLLFIANVMSFISNL